MQIPVVPRWLLDGTSVENEFFVVHTHSPRFIARLYFTSEREKVSRPAIAIQDEWLAVPVEWIDRYDRTTWNAEEMEDSLNNAFAKLCVQEHDVASKSPPQEEGL